MYIKNEWGSGGVIIYRIDDTGWKLIRNTRNLSKRDERYTWEIIEESINHWRSTSWPNCKWLVYTEDEMFLEEL